MATTTSLSTIAYYLALIGGILMVLLGLISFFGIFRVFFFHWDFSYGAIVTIVMGIIAIIGSRSASTLAWSIVLIIVGLIGGGIGGLLVVLGGLLGLIQYLTRKA
jgi:hypothetical protein